MPTTIRARVLWAAIAGLAIGGTATASINLPLSFEALVGASEVIVLGRVSDIASGVDPTVDGVYTYVTVQPSEMLKGLPPGSGPIVVKQLGGMVADRGVYVPGQPRFALGEEVLLFLGARPRDRSLFTLGLWQGKWSIEREAVSDERIGLQREAQTQRTVARRALTALRSEIARLVRLSPARAADVRIAPDEHPVRRQSSAFVLNDPPIRWMQSVVPVHVETGTQPGLPGGGLTEIAGARGQWNAVGSTLTLSAGNRVPPRCQASSGSDILVTFNDPCGEISSDPALLAVAAFGFTPGAGQVVNGVTFFPITDSVITTSSNAAAQPFLTVSPCFQSTMAHELGHAIGLDHTPDPTALMFFSETGACFSGVIPVGPDDLAGFLTIYGSGGGAPPPGGPPGQPTVTAASATAGVLNVSWTSGPGGTPTAHRLDFFSGGALAASLTVGAATSAAIPIPAGTQGSFTVRVTALVGALASAPSAAFPFTIGGPPGGGSGGCTAPPPSPVVSGSLVSGTATVTWAAIPGATYIVSAGSTQGGTNLQAPTNVGSSTSVGASGLPAGFTAFVRVVAVNACGQSAPTDFFLSGGGGAPGPGPGSGASIVIQGSAAACACWNSPVSVEIDGTASGSLACSGSAGPFPVSAGNHTIRLCDSLGCATSNSSVSTVLTINLTCGS